MDSIRSKWAAAKEHKNEAGRYVINGIVATLTHFCILTFNIEVLGVQSAGVANFIAACLAIVVSFLGSRYFVFRKQHNSVMSQALRFGVLYLALAVTQGVIMYLWSDVFDLDYRVGFVVATGVQVVCSYLGNKFFVFHEEPPK